MKYLILFVLLITPFILGQPTNPTISRPELELVTGKRIVHSGVSTIGTASANTSAIQSALTSIGSKGILLVEKGTYKVNSLTIPDSVTLRFMIGGILQIQTGQTLTDSGDIDAQPNQQIFDTTGTILLPNISIVYANWFGAKGDGIIDNRHYIQKAANSFSGAGHIVLGRGTYMVSCGLLPRDAAGIVVHSGITLSGAGMDLTTIKRMANQDSLSHVIFNQNISGGDSNITIENLTIDGNSANNPVLMNYSQYGLSLYAVNTVHINNVRVKNVRGTTNGAGRGEGADFELLGCNDVTISNSISIGDSYSATGFSISAVTNFTMENDVSYGHQIGHGFTHWKSSNGSYVSCKSYNNYNGSNGSQSYGFNSEASDRIVYTNCIAGGTSAIVSSAGWPFQIDSTIGNYHGFVSYYDSSLISYVNCISDYNKGCGIFINGSKGVKVIGGSYSYNGMYGVSSQTNYGTSFKTYDEPIMVGDTISAIFANDLREINYVPNSYDYLVTADGIINANKIIGTKHLNVTDINSYAIIAKDSIRSTDKIGMGYDLINNRGVISAIQDTGGDVYVSNSPYIAGSTIGTFPSAPTLSSPSNGATNISTNIVLSWNAVSGADDYSLSIFDNNDTTLVYNSYVGNVTSFDCSGYLPYVNTFAWWVTPRSGITIGTGSAHWLFTTVLPPPVPGWKDIQINPNGGRLLTHTLASDTILISKVLQIGGSSAPLIDSTRIAGDSLVFFMSNGNHYVAFKSGTYVPPISPIQYYVSSAGNDANDGTIGTPWLTIGKVNTMITTGTHTVSFKCGDRFNDASLLPKSNCTYNSYGPGARPVIDGLQTRYCIDLITGGQSNKTNILFDGIKFVHGLNSDICMWGGSYITFDNCNIDSAYQTGWISAPYGMIYIGGTGSEVTHHISIKNSTLSYSKYGHGIYANGVKELLMEYDTLRGNGAVGLQLMPYTTTDRADSAIIRYCVIDSNNTYGAGSAEFYVESATNSQIYYNIIKTNSSQTSYPGIELTGEYANSGNTGFYNNTIICHGSGTYAWSIALDNTATLDSIYIRNNIVYCDNSGGYAYYFYHTVGSHFYLSNNGYYIPGGSTHLFHLTSDYAGTVTGFHSWKAVSHGSGVYQYWDTTGSVLSDPLFITNFSNLSLLSTSPAKNTGVNIGLTQDILGNTIVGNPDIGAYERTSIGNIYYVDKNASGTGSALSWTNASTTISGLPWPSINGGDTVYVSGGTGSLVYPKDSVISKYHNTPVVIARSWESGHNGKPIFSTSTNPGGYRSTFYVGSCIGIKFVGLKFTTTNTTDAKDDVKILFIDHASNIVIDNCDVISNGIGTGISMKYDTSITISNSHIETLVNNYLTSCDPIFVEYGAGGHTFIGNTMIQGGTNNYFAHKDIIQMDEEGSALNLQLTIANNFFLYSSGRSDTSAQSIYCANSHLNRFLIYNNVIVTNARTNVPIDIFGYSTYRPSVRLYNNTTLTGAASDGCIAIGDVDTLIMKNNIFIMDSSNAHENLYFSGSGLANIKYKDIDYNQYYTPHYTGFLADTGGADITWTRWKALGYDTHSDTGVVSFVNKWGTNTVDYKLTSISAGVDQGTTIGTFTTDIIGVLRPQGSKWDRGAFEYEPIY